MKIRVHALVPAAGQSVRFGGTTLKQYAHLLGQPVLAHSIQSLLTHPAIAAVTVALAPDDGIYAELIQPRYPGVGTVRGGETRARSVYNGLRHIRDTDPGSSWVLVHDAARPCLTAGLLDALLEQGLSSAHGAILAVPVGDTLKLADAAGLIECTISRTGVWAAQTPQLFPLPELLMHVESALHFGEPPTDEAEAMERAGFKPMLVSGSAQNVKITGPEDLAIAEFILRQRVVEA